MKRAFAIVLVATGCMLALWLGHDMIPFVKRQREWTWAYRIASFSSAYGRLPRDREELNLWTCGDGGRDVVPREVVFAQGASLDDVLGERVSPTRWNGRDGERGEFINRHVVRLLRHMRQDDSNGEDHDSK